jgi:hypothetical protein
MGVLMSAQIWTIVVIVETDGPTPRCLCHANCPVIKAKPRYRYEYVVLADNDATATEIGLAKFAERTTGWIAVDTRVHPQGTCSETVRGHPYP